MSVEDPVGLAVVGVGPIGLKHLQALEEEPACRTVAIVDPAPAAAGIARERGLPLYASLEVMLDEATPKGVIIATPNDLHVPLSLACVERGIPVLVEKPVADTVEAARSLADAADAAGVPVLVGHHRRHSPIVGKAREVVRSGALGELVAVSALCLVHKPDGYFQAAWRRRAGGGPVLINLIHDMDSLRFMAGEISSVQAVASNRQRGFEVEDTAAVLLRFENGALGTVTLSDRAVAPWSWELTAGERTSYDFPRTGQDCYFLAGTKGALGVPSLRLWRQEEAQDWQAPLPEESASVKDGNPIRNQAAHFAEVIRGRADPLITARDAARTLEATLAVTRSAATGREVTLSSSQQQHARPLPRADVQGQSSE